MGKFEEQLLADLMQEHGSELEGAERPRRRGTKPVWIAAGAVVVAGAATGAVLLWPTAAPASAVTDNGDGTVTVSVKNAGAVDEVNKELQNKKLPVRFTFTQDALCDGKPLTVELQTLDATVKQIEAGGSNPIYRLESRPDGSITVRVIGCDSRQPPTK